MRAKRWAETPMGRPETWSSSVKTAVSICLNSKFPILLWIGQELRLVYNDAYIPFLGKAKHPFVVGEPGRTAWGEIWGTIGPMLQGVQAGDATWVDHQQMFFARRLPREEVYVTFGYSPIYGADNVSIDGVFGACYETTKEVVREQRLSTISGLGARTAKRGGVEAACASAIKVLEGNPLDIPFAAIYLREDDTTARLCGLTQSLQGSPTFPLLLPIDEARRWPLGRVAETSRDVEVSGVGDGDDPLFAPLWPDRVQTVLVYPLIIAAQPELVGFLIVGVSPRRILDADYRNFFSLVAGHISTNIGDAQAFERERRRADALAEIDRAKTAFFSNVSHEFRTPLTLMLGPLEQMLGETATKLDDETRSLAKMAHNNGLRLLRLVNALLAFSRMEAGRLQARFRPTDVAALTAALASTFRFACEQAGLRLDIDCRPGSEPVYIDSHMWETIVLNILSNAFKHTHEGRIGVQTRFDDANAYLLVADTGVGIADTDLPRIFERFYRVEGQRSRSVEGSGIGLALVADLVKLHGGSIAVESLLGQGTTFTITVPSGTSHLPAECVSDEAPAASGPDRETRIFAAEAEKWLIPDRDLGTASDNHGAPGPPLESSPARILLADDNDDMRTYITRLLSKWWKVEAVVDGRQALEAARRRKPDLVLTDLMMPVMNGHQLAAALRADADLRALPIIVLSARAGDDAAIEGLNSGADDYLVKPFAAAELVARVKSHLTLSRQRNNEIAVLNRLHGLSARLTATSELSVALYEALDAAMELLGADFGDIQLLDEDTATLSIAAHRILPDEFLEYFRSADATHTSACGMALRDQIQVVIEDVTKHPEYAPHLGIAASTGYRAVISTPLFERGSGKPVGMLSTMFRQPFRPTSHDLRILDLYARQAGDVIGSRLSEQRLRESDERFREFAQHSTDVLWIHEEATSRLSYLSPAFERVWGVAPADPPMLADLLAGIFVDDRAQAGDALRRVRSGESIVQQHRVVRPDGAVRWIHHTVFPIRNAEGRIHRLGGIAQDITKESSSLVYLIADAVHTELADPLRGAGYSVKPFKSARAFLRVAPSLLPGCVVLDISRSGASELDVVRECKARRSRHPMIVAGNCHGNVGLAVDAMKAGAVDWLETPVRPEALLSSVATALADVVVASEREQEAELARKRISALSSREQEVLLGLVAGRTNKEIGRNIGISPRTVEIHRSNLMHRLDVQTLPEAVLLVAAAGLQPSRRA